MYVSKNTLIFALATAFVILIGSPTGFIIWENYHSKYSYGEIVIHKNSDFVNRYNFPGSGTENDPYIIENLILSTQKRYAIFIGDTTSFFVIRNCEIIFNQIGIYLNNIKRGTAKIENNIMEYKQAYYYSNLQSIVVYFASDIVICNNTCSFDNEIYTSGYGITIYDSRNSIIANNTCFGFLIGIEVTSGSDFSTIENNLCQFNDRGIIIRSDSCVIYHNTLKYNSDYGVSLYYCDYNHIYHNNFIDNHYILNNNNRSQGYEKRKSYTSYNNRWYDATLQEGNYWSNLNWTEEAIYEMEGSIHIFDIYPLQYPI